VPSRLDEDPAAPPPIGRIRPPLAARVTCRRDPHHDALLWAFEGKVVYRHLSSAIDRPTRSVSPSSSSGTSSTAI
jgi:hypothetical protein